MSAKILLVAVAIFCAVEARATYDVQERASAVEMVSISGILSCLDQRNLLAEIGNLLKADTEKCFEDELALVQEKIDAVTALDAEAQEIAQWANDAIDKCANQTANIVTDGLCLLKYVPQLAGRAFALAGKFAAGSAKVGVQVNILAVRFPACTAKSVANRALEAAKRVPSEIGRCIKNNGQGLFLV